jgi:hypothetical protein
MEPLLGTSLKVFLGITGVLTGFCAFMTGQAIAETWRPYWQVVFYCALLGAVARFLIYGLFDGALFSLSGYLIGAALLILIGSFAFLTKRARKMVLQYPWLYRRTGLFAWRPLHPDASQRPNP